MWLLYILVSVVAASDRNCPVQPSENTHPMLKTIAPVRVRHLTSNTFPLNPKARLVPAKCVDTEKGFDYQLFIHDPAECVFLSGNLFFYKNWECRNIQNIISTLSSSPHGNRTTFMDIGANLGTYTIPVATAGFRVVGFEPMQYNHELLAASIGTFGFSESVHIYPTAVSNSTSTHCLSPTSDDNKGNGQIVDCKDAVRNGWTHQTISSRTIDDVVAHHDLCYTVVKADVEGFELQAFQGALQTVFESDCPPEMVLFEHHQGWKEPAIFEFMTQKGYQCARFSLSDYKCVPFGKPLAKHDQSYWDNLSEKTIEHTNNMVNQVKNE